MTFEKRLKAALALNGLTLKDLAKTLEISPQALHRKIENVSFSVRQAKTICEMFSIADPFNFFFGNEVT